MKVLKNSNALIVAAALLMPLLVFAAGGGGGGGGGSVPPPPVCDADAWSCSPWEECQLNGTQSRTCALTFDCPTANTPKPPTEQNCTPACIEDLYSCGDWDLCDAQGKQRRICGRTFDCPLTETPKPIEEQNCQPACTADIWTCANFGACVGGKQTRSCALTFDCPGVATPKLTESQSCIAPPPPCVKDEYECSAWSQCQESGRDTRTCALKRDCPRVSTPKPEESRVCAGLRCGHLATLKERISCRLRLSNQELANEFKILFAPEACKAFRDQSEKVECIRLYQRLGSCWQISVGNARNACARNIIGIENIVQGKSECGRLKNKERQKCLDDLKEKVLYLVVFRLYDLEVRAETLMERGAPVELVTDLETFIETKKREMYATDNTADWKRIVMEVQGKWREFINRVRPLLK